jgi:voltage-gated potassium channel
MKKKYWDLIILVLSLYVILELAVELIYPFSQASIDLINIFDLIICVIFLGDFFFFLWKSEDKKNYLKVHWIDFIASIPFMTFMRIFRLVRVIRIVRLLRGVKGLIQIFKLLGTNKLQNVLISYIIVLILVMGYSSLAFYTFEKGINNNVNSLFDAFWWAFITTTTVGYGDIYPVTTQGRIISMVLALCGMGLFSLITAEITTVLYRISKEAKNQKSESNICPLYPPEKRGLERDPVQNGFPVHLIPLSDIYSIYQVNNEKEIPDGIYRSGFYSVTKTDDEISILTNCETPFPNLKSEKGWKGFKVAGILDFSLVGIINDLTKPLKEHGISVFVVSTFITDYLFVKETDFQKAIGIFEKTETVRIQKWEYE